MKYVFRHKTSRSADEESVQFHAGADAHLPVGLLAASAGLASVSRPGGLSAAAGPFRSCLAQPAQSGLSSAAVLVRWSDNQERACEVPLLSLHPHGFSTLAASFFCLCSSAPPKPCRRREVPSSKVFSRFRQETSSSGG